METMETMETVDVVMKMPRVDGYEYTGEFRRTKMGEICWSPVTESVQLCDSNGTLARAILRKVPVWKKLTLEKALTMGKSREKFIFRHFPYSIPVAPVGFSETVDYIDLNPDTRLNVRLGFYGWVCNSDIEYLEE